MIDRQILLKNLLPTIGNGSALWIYLFLLNEFGAIFLIIWHYESQRQTQHFI